MTVLIRVIIVLYMLATASPAFATFTYDGPAGGGGSNPVQNPDMELTANWIEYEAAWNWVPHATTDYTTSLAQSGARSYKINMGWTDGEDTYRDGIYQGITVTANTEYVFKAWVRDDANTGGMQIRVSTAIKGGGTVICETGDATSNINVWTQITCTVPNTNTNTSLYVAFLSPTYQAGKFGYVDNITLEAQPDVGNIYLTLPAGSTGRVVSVTNDSGTVAAQQTAAGTSMTLAGLSNGNYYFSITDTDGKTFLDNSAFAALAPQTVSENWSWTNANLAKDATWDLVLHGDTDANGNCLDNGASGCYHTITRNGTDYLDLGPRLGANLAAGKTVTASGTGAANLTDGNKNTYWSGATSGTESVCIDLGSAQAFNRIDLFARSTGYAAYYTFKSFGPKDPVIEVSSADTDCTAGTWSSAASYTRTAKENGLVFLSLSFPAQTKRFVRVKGTTWGTNTDQTTASMQEVEIYNEGAGNSGSDVHHLVLTRQTPAGGEGAYRSLVSRVGVKWDSYIVEADGTKTFTKAFASTDFNAELKVNYKKIADTWRARYTVSSDQPTYMQVHLGIMKYMSSSVPCLAAEPWTFEWSDGREVGTCTWKAANHPVARLGPPVSVMGTPYMFGVAADSGCQAQYSKSGWDSTGDGHTHDVVEFKKTSNWAASVVQYGQEETNNPPDFRVDATPRWFDVALSREVLPEYEYAVKTAVASLADAKNKTNFDEHNKLLYASALGRLGRMASAPENCLSIHHRQHTDKDAHPIDNALSVVGLNEQKAVLDQIYAWRRGDMDGNGYSAYVMMTDNLNNSPGSFVTPPNKQSYSEGAAYMLAFAKTRGWLTVTADCTITDKTCISNAERDELYANINAQISANGDLWGGWGHLYPAEAGATAYNSDVYTWRLAQFYVVYKGLQLLGANVDTVKLSNMKTVLQSLYDGTDGYIRIVKYGPWLSYGNSAASGGNYKLGRPELATPTGARFVVPSGHTNAAWSFTYAAGAGNGKVSIKKNGTPVAESPLDQYGSFWTGYDVNYEVITVTAGTLKADGITARPTYGPTHPGELNGRPFMTPHYKDVADFSGVNNKLRLRVKSYTNGPTGVVVLFTEGVTCTGLSWSCYQYFPNVIVADGTWQDIELTMTGTWGSGETIGMLRFDYTDQTDSTGTVEVDYLRKFDGTTETAIDEFNVDGPFTTASITGTVSTGDVITISLEPNGTYDCARNGAALPYCHMTIDKLTIGGTAYEETDAAWQCPSDRSMYDCSGGYSQGWRRFKNGKTLFWVNQADVLYGEKLFTPAQIRSHIEKMSATNLGNGTFGSANSTYLDTPVPSYYFNGSAGGNANAYGQFNFSSWLIWDAHAWYYASTVLGDTEIWYSWDEKADKFRQVVGTWTDELDPNEIGALNGFNGGNYFGRRVWKSSTAGHVIEFADVPYTDLDAYFITGTGQGVVKIYHDNAGAGYDAGTTVDLSSGGGGGIAPTLVYSKTGLTHSSLHKVKFEVVSGTVRLDYVRAKTKPSTMLNFRFDMEFTVHPVIQNYLTSGWGVSGYGSTNFYSTWSHIDLMYRGAPLSGIKRKDWRENMFFRRLAQ